MLGFGIFGYIMTKLKYPIVPLVLAMVLGRLADKSRCQARTISGENQTNFFTRFIALLVFSASILAHFRPVNR